MKKCLIIGSAVADVILNLDSLPRSGDDITVHRHHLFPGGCAFNTSEILRQLSVPYTLCAPVGTGIYGQFIREALKKRRIPVFISVPDAENGCCFCMVESNGERTFLSRHGAEYLFRREWMDKIKIEMYDSVYVSGLEVEEPTGDDLVSYIEEAVSRHSGPFTVYFAPGPRIQYIDKKRIARLLAVHPVLHLNEREAVSLSGKDSVEDCARTIAAVTKNDVIITCGKSGAYCLDYDETKDGQTVIHIPGFPVRAVDTIGAGDSHMGSVISYRKRGLSLPEAVLRANKIAAACTGVTGALLPDHVVAELGKI